MRKIDLIRSALGGLWRQKARTSLTLLGVAVGSCALAFSLSLGLGLRALIDNEFQSREDFWWVTVFPANRGQTLIDEKDIPPEKIKPESRLYEELDIDSIDAVDLIVRMKPMVGKRMQPEAFKAVRTVQDVVDALYLLIHSP